MAATGMPAPLVRMCGITKRFAGVVANRDVDLQLSGGRIHGLLGENGAGKSTLMNVLYGLHQPDEGHIEIGGERVDITSPRDALSLGIGMVHQHFMLVPDMTVAENIALGLQPGPPRRARLQRVASRVRELSERYGLRVDPDRVVETLSVGAKQRAEILKLLYRGAEVLILDEPTAVLTPAEWGQLLAVLRTLTAEGKSVVLITHKLDEIIDAADRCTVLRDGIAVGTVATADVDKVRLARMMVGRDVELRVERPRVPAGRPVLDVRDLRLVDEGGTTLIDGIDLEVHAGEVLGLAGVDGNGQRELEELLTGLRSPSGGEIVIGGETFTSLTPRLFAEAGGAVIPEDRHRTGIARELSVTDNLLLHDIAHAPFARHGLLDPRACRNHAAELIARYDIRAPSPDVLLRQLSGGNQQRVVLARELSREPRLLIASQPTRGLDVGVMEFVYQELSAHKERGGATLLISTELEEILSLSDRIGVLFDGRLVGVLDIGQAKVESIGLLMAGQELAA
jgi:ABC-type uncharacterized transport system ATPase subunit